MATRNNAGVKGRHPCQTPDGVEKRLETVINNYCDISIKSNQIKFNSSEQAAFWDNTDNTKQQWKNHIKVQKGY